MPKYLALVVLWSLVVVCTYSLPGSSLDCNLTNHSSHGKSGIWVDSINVSGEDETNSYHVYKSDNITWCGAFLNCQEKGQNLAILEDEAIEGNIIFIEGILNPANGSSSSAHAWLSGRRVIDWQWTWIEDTLRPCEKDQSDECPNVNTGDERGEAALLVYMGEVENKNIVIVKGYLPSSKFSYVCLLPNSEVEVSDKLGNEKSWFDSQNSCFLEGGRLATLDELRQQVSTNISLTNTWIGLYRHPWAWFFSGVEEGSAVGKPTRVYNWAEDEPQQQCDCLSVDMMNGLWIARDCHNELSYYICQETIHDRSQDLTTSSTRFEKPNRGQATNHSKSEKLLWLLMLLLIPAAGLVYYLCRLEKKLWNRNNDGSTGQSPEENMAEL